MPPHCDSMDGPVVRAARRALEAKDVTLVLPYVKKQREGEVIEAFEKVLEARKTCDAAREVADLHFFETVVRIHRIGEGAPFSGLQPAGLDEGPIIPVVERAMETSSADELTHLLCTAARGEVHRRFDRVMQLKEHARDGVEEAREYVEAMLALEVYAQKLHEHVKAGAPESHEARA